MPRTSRKNQENYRKTMKDIEQLIEQMHAENRKRLEQESLPQDKKELRLGEQEASPEGGKHLWRYAAALALVVGVAAVSLLPLRQERQQSHLAKADVARTDRQMPQLAHADVPQPLRQHLEDVGQTDAKIKPTAPKIDYAYSETDQGVRVYCDDGCNADEVLEKVQRVIETLE